MSNPGPYPEQNQYLLSHAGGWNTSPTDAGAYDQQLQAHQQPQYDQQPTWQTCPYCQQPYYNYPGSGCTCPDSLNAAAAYSAPQQSTPTTGQTHPYTTPNTYSNDPNQYTSYTDYPATSPASPYSSPSSSGSTVTSGGFSSTETAATADTEISTTSTLGFGAIEPAMPHEVTGIWPGIGAANDHNWGPGGYGAPNPSTGSYLGSSSYPSGSSTTG